MSEHEPRQESTGQTGGPSGSLPGLAQGAPYKARSLAVLGLARSAATAADSATGLVPTGPPGRYRFPGAGLEDALGFLADAQRVVDAAIVVERLHGTSWDDIATMVTDHGEHRLSPGRSAVGAPGYRSGSSNAAAPPCPA